MPAVESTAVLAYANSISSFLLAVSSPLFGAIADEGGLRKALLALFTLIGAGATGILYFVGAGEWIMAAWIYSIAAFSFTASSTFYDALLVQVAKPKDFDRVSGFGYALGYLGGGLLFALNVAMYLKWSVSGVQFSFLSVGVWWILFSIPLFLFVPEGASRKKIALKRAFTAGFWQLISHLKKIRREKAILFFLVGYLFYVDGVNTIVKMAVDYGLAIGLESTDLIKALLLVQFIGFPAAIAFGFVGEKYGPRRGIWICLAVYLGVTVFAYFIQTSFEFYIVAAVIGLVQGGIQSLSRSLYARLVPPEKSAEYFGFFNMAGKFSAISGPVLVALTGLLFESSRAGILVLVIYFLIGGFFLKWSERYI